MDDMELIDAGYSMEELRILKALSRASDSLAHEMNIHPGIIFHEMNLILEDYQWNLLITESVETAKKAKKDLRNLATRAEALADAMMSLGEGAMEVLCRPTLRMDLIEAAELSNLPDSRPWGNHHGELFGPPDKGPWIARLRGLSELARAKADRIEEKTRKGGRLSFGARIHGSPDERLARACKAFTEANGCHSQALAIKIVRTIQCAAGRGGLTPHSGRKAVRKVAQTKQSKGPV